MTIRPPRRVDLHHPQSFPQTQTPRLYRNIAVTFLGLTVVVVALAVWMSSARATVIVHVKHDDQNIDSIVEIAKQPQLGQLQGRVVEGIFDNIQEFPVQVTADAVASSSSGAVPLVTDIATSTPVPAVATPPAMGESGSSDRYLGGRVRIVNRYSKPQTLVKTTRLLSANGGLYRIAATVTVPSGQSVEVDAYADKPGTDTALASGTHFTIPGLWIDLQKWIYAEAVSAFVPSDRHAPIAAAAVASPLAPALPTQTAPKAVVKAMDIDAAETSLQNAVVEKAEKTLLTESGIPADRVGEACAQDSGCWEAVYVVQPLEKKTNVTVGQQTDRFMAQVKVKVTAVYYPRKDMQALVQSKLKERLPDGRDIVGVDPRNIEYKLESTDTRQEVARLHITAKATSRLSSQNPQLSKDVVAGLSVGDAKKRLAGIEGVEGVDVTMQPSWSRTIPTNRQKIEVRVE